jgi:transcriptional regulator with XRE-family HTH domain/tetratricopeptide (TPR) repeat protein
MRIDQGQGAFAKELERVLAQTDTSVRRLERLCGISRRTLENWLYGQSQRPRHVDSILKIASALHLPAPETNKLLAAAEYPVLEELMNQTGQVPSQLLADWQLAPNQLLGKKNAALPAQDNLPAEVTPFIGRDDASVELALLIHRPDIRLITVSGLGGVGKTRLAVETARSLVNRFDHGVYFIPLDNINDAEGFWEGIIKGLHIPADGGNSRRHIVEDYLRNKQVMLLLDNFEHVMHLNCEISRLLSKYPRLKLLVTSRLALDLQAEQLYPISGLSTEAGQNSPSYQLYLATARRRIPGYIPTSQEALDIIALCETVEGLPLAIELAATWSDILSPGQILEHLQNDMHDVWHYAADRPDRQKSLWELFDYSWRMLPDLEQEAAMRLNVLRGSFSPEMALAIAGCSPAVIKRLVQASFIMRTSGSRLMIHRLVRQFLAHQAERAGIRKEELETNFMEITLAWTSEQSLLLRKTFKAVYFQNMHREWQHIERAWWMAVDRHEYDRLESCWDILFYFEARGNWGEGNNFFEATREKIGSNNPRMQARLDEAQAIFAVRTFDIPRSLKLARRSLKTLDELGITSDRDGVGAYARLVITGAEYQLKQASFSEENKQELRQKTGSYLLLFTDVTIAMSDGVKCCMQEDFEGAAAAFEKALTICGLDAYTVPNIRCFLAIAYRAGGRNEEAREQFILAKNYAEKIDILPALVTAAYEMPLLEGDNVSTLYSRQSLEELALELGSRRTVGRVAIINAIQYLNLGMFNYAKQLTRMGLSLFWNQAGNAERRRILSTIAQAYIAFGLIKTAPQLLSLVMPELSD